MYTFKITYLFIIYNLITFFPYISISVHSILFNFCFFLIFVLYSIPSVLFLCMSALSCMSALCLYFFCTGSSCHQDKFLVFKHTCNKALLIRLVVFLTIIAVIMSLSISGFLLTGPQTSFDSMSDGCLRYKKVRS